MAAEILAFPSLGRPAESRLARAMQELDTALAEQRAAVTAWRDSLRELQKSVQGLNVGLRRYQTTLQVLAADLAALNKAARALEQQADGVIAPEQSTAV